MDFEDLLTSLDIWKFYRDPPVKTSRTEKCRVKGIRLVSRCQNHNPPGTVKSIHLGKELIQSLLTLIVATAKTCASLATYSVNLINKDDTR